MSEEEIKNGNMIIAEFMGLRGNWLFDEKNAEYHSDWSWLMPVVQKIKQWEHLPQYMFMGTTLERHMEFSAVTLLPICSSIGTVFRAVVRFIKWYNLQLETAPRSPLKKVNHE